MNTILKKRTGACFAIEELLITFGLSMKATHYSINENSFLAKIGCDEDKMKEYELRGDLRGYYGYHSFQNYPNTEESGWWLGLSFPVLEDRGGEQFLHTPRQLEEPYLIVGDAVRGEVEIRGKKRQVRTMTIWCNKREIIIAKIL